MPFYLTRDPVPSADMRNVFDNAQNLDLALNDLTSSLWTDRLGRSRMSWFGLESAFSVKLSDFESRFTSQIVEQEATFDASQADKENRFQHFLVSSGYVFLGDYEDGPFQFSARNQYIRYDNQYYRLNAATDVGFTTTGTDATSFVNDVTHFVLMDGDTLRQNLGSSEKGLGTYLIGHEDGGVVRDYIHYLTPQSQGAPCDGINDDSTWFNALANSGKKVVVPAGNYVLDCNKINISTSDCEIEFDKNAKVQVVNTSGLSGANAEAVVFRITGTSLATVYNVRISGGQFTYANDTIALVGVLSYADGVKVERVNVTGLRLISTNDANNNYTNSTSASRSKRVSATFCKATAATVSTRGAAISFRYSDYGTTSNNIIYGYYYGIMFWGGDSNTGSNGGLGNERKCVGIRSTTDRISATKAAWWGSMGMDCVATALSCYGLGTDTDVGIDFEGCVRCSAVGCYVKDFRYGCYATFFYSDGVVFDSCHAEVTTEGYRVFTINNSSQNANNRSVTYNNCMFSGVGCCSIVYQQGAISDLVISNCTFRNVVLHLDSLNNGRIGINNLNLVFDRVPVDGRVFNSVTYYAALVINASLLALRDAVINSSVSWTGVPGESVGIIMLSRSSNANALHRVDGGGITSAQFSTDVIFANMGVNNGLTLRYEVDKFIFANKTYKTLLFSTSTLIPIGIMRGKTLTFSDFPTSITDNLGYADTYYTRRQQFINQSPTAGGVLGTVVVTAGVGTSAVTANIPIS
ncbi:TPA: hypothetical protein ME973_003922 [Klebsiella pneumoniae]|nr:hypothetical protein [Klebsiella pneumoniae]HBW6480051.1 hypothetical protein [Klebsiella pneumoniae]